jgi:hypothetical protein
MTYQGNRPDMDQCAARVFRAGDRPPNRVESAMNVSRRCFLHRSAAVVGGIGLAGVGAARSQAADTKVAKTLVGYQDSPQGRQQCDNCQYFQPPNACKIVAGAISPKGWCKMWAKKS